MSTQTARQFLERLSEDSGWQMQFYIADPYKLERFLRFAHGKGYIFAAEDLAAALPDSPSSPIIDKMRNRMKVNV
jgi:hypothetical protein